MAKKTFVPLLAAALAFGLWAVAFSSPVQAQEKQPAAGQPVNVPTERQVTPEEAFTLLSKAAEEGQPQAMNSLGTLYERGLGVARNYSQALAWYQKAAAAGLAEGFHQVGQAYELGKGVAADQAEAVKYYQRAAQMKLAEANYRLATLSLAGPPAKPDEKKALEYLKAQGLADGPAMDYLGTVY
ncbi:sel1 repeat family protein, partial [Deltaproteobacteria bacterium OttesenSCG-928-M10]|nr:sel1 repeat family protein [Deltaproteobacteria bacterium OttesenSCG-928-M10]